jgi:hypothetical protein
MNRVISILAAICALAVSYARPASAGCPTDAGYRDFPLFTLNDAAANLVFGNVTIGGMNTVAACNTLNNTLEFFRNGLNPEFYSSLPQNTKLCLFGGNDRVRVLRQGETLDCGTFNGVPNHFTALAYGGKKLLLVGQAGSDTLIGGDGADRQDMNTDDTAGSSDRSATGRGNDEIRFSSKSTSRGWGGSGSDTYLSSGGSVFVRAQDLRGTSEVYSGSTASFDKFCDGEDQSFSSSFCGGGTAFDNPNDLVNFAFGHVSCPFSFVCEDMGASIPRTDT